MIQASSWLLEPEKLIIGYRQGIFAAFIDKNGILAMKEDQ